MGQDEEVITTTAAERRLGGALMWTGMLLGAMFIGVLGLSFMLYTNVYSETGTLKTYEKTNKELTEKLDAKSTALTKAEQDLKEANRVNAELNAKLTAKPAPVKRVVRPADPF
jgi:hypothetical protein